MSVKTFILARGGSVGVPRKNLQKIAGKTLLARCITAAAFTAPLEDIIVFTEDHDIRQEALSCGVSVMHSPPEYARGDRPTDEHVLYMLDQLESVNNLPTHVAYLQCTAPFLLSRDITRCIEAVTVDGYDSAFCAAKTHKKLWWGWPDLEAGLPINFTYPRQPRQQEERQQWIEAGSCYAFTVASFRRAKSRFCGKTKLVEISETRCVEIDTMDELKLARALMEGWEG